MNGLMRDGEAKSRRIYGIRKTLDAAATVVALLIAGGIEVAVAANNLPPPAGKVLLVAKGAIARTNVDAEAHLDRERLEAIGITKIVTRTPWTDEDTAFEGVLARDVMRALGATGTTARAIAANNYKVTIPLADFELYDVLFAVRVNGELLSLRTRGPIWVIYPETANIGEKEREERMIWQLVELYIE